MLNKVQMIGRLTRDPERKVLPSGTALANFSLAVNEVWNKNGEKMEKTVFTEWQVWNGQSDVMCKIAGKGDLIYVEGKFGLDEWEDSEGNKRSRPRFTALAWQLLSKAGSGKNNHKDINEVDEKPSVKKGCPKKESATPTPSVQITSISNDDEDDDSDIPF